MCIRDSSPGGPPDVAVGRGGVGGTGGATTGGTGGAGGTATGGAGGSSGTSGSSGTGGAPSTPVCATASHCAAGQDCCLSTGQCFDIGARPVACPSPMPDTTPQGLKRCASNGDCNGDAYCAGDLCLGVGVCLPRPRECGTQPGPFCGCDGKEYPNAFAACQAGVRLPQIEMPTACGKAPVRDGSLGGGRTLCGSRAQCAAGEDCCLITGRCYNPAFPTLCTFPPSGTFSPCVDDSECYPPSTACWSSTGCEGPGYCRGSISGQCSSVLEPVCGCDGKSYTNEECAWQKMVRVRHAGTCPAP